MSADNRAHAAVHAAVAGGLLEPASSCECQDRTIIVAAQRYLRDWEGRQKRSAGGAEAH